MKRTSTLLALILAISVRGLTPMKLRILNYGIPSTNGLIANLGISTTQSRLAITMHLSLIRLYSAADR